MLYLWVRDFLPFLETSLPVLGLSCALQKKGRLLVLNPPPEGEGSIRLESWDFVCSFWLCMFFSFVGYQTCFPELEWKQCMFLLRSSE